MKRPRNDLLGISIFSMVVFLLTFSVIVTYGSKTKPPSPYKTSLWGVVINKDFGDSLKNKVFHPFDQERWHLRRLDNVENLQEAQAIEKNSIENIP